ETFVDALTYSFQVPRDLPAMLTLGALSVALGGKFIVRPRRDYIEPVNLYLAVALPPGERKSGVKRMVCAPIDQMERELCEQAERKKESAKKENDDAEQATDLYLND